MFRYTGNIGTSVSSVSLRFQAPERCVLSCCLLFFTCSSCGRIFHPIFVFRACSSRHRLTFSMRRGGVLSLYMTSAWRSSSLCFVHQDLHTACSSGFTHMFITMYVHYVHRDLHTLCSSRLTHIMFITIYIHYVHHDLNTLFVEHRLANTTRCRETSFV